MTTPAEAIEDGHLGDALALQRAIVAETPRDPKSQLLLFELLTLAGHLHEARDLLRSIDSADPSWPEYRRRLKHILKAEYRRSVRGDRPIVIPTIPSHAKARWNAQRAADPDRRTKLLDKADHRTPHVTGHVDGREFDGIRDMDDRFASVLELLIAGDYVWLPWESIRRIRLAKPEGLLDVAYRDVTIELQDGDRIDGTVPLLYPGSYASNGIFALGQDTDWNDTQGIGQRILMLGDEEIALADCRQIEFTKQR